MSIETLQIGNSAGFAKSTAEARLLARLPTTFATLGAFTWEELPGNGGEVYGEADRGGKLNWLGMPNPGLKEGSGTLRAMIELIHGSGKFTVVNFAGFSVEEYTLGARAVYEAGAGAAEVNLGCPNVEKAIVSFDLPQLRRVVDGIATAVPTDFPLWLKLSPYSDPAQLAKVAELVNLMADSPLHRQRELAVVCSNTFPNAYGFKPGTLEPLISGTGLAGYSGPGYKPIVLGQVKQFRALLHDRIGIVAAGDIQTSQDIREYVAMGAGRFQIGNAFIYGPDPRVFERVIGEYAELVS